MINDIRSATLVQEQKIGSLSGVVRGDQSFWHRQQERREPHSSLCCRSPRPWLSAEEQASSCLEKRVDMFANGNRAFEIGKMSAVFQRDHAGIRNCLSDVLSRRGGMKSWSP
jgi:hypothetical protein